MSILSDQQKIEFLEVMGNFIPHVKLLDISLETMVGAELTLRLPYREELVGDPQTGTLHGGVLTVLLDQTMGMSAICCDNVKPSVTPTLDLRIDHLGVAPPGMDIFATASVYKATRKILFVEGIAWCESRDKPIARAVGSWVRVTDIDVSAFLDFAQEGTAQ